MKTARKITLFIALALCTVCLIAGLFALKPVFAYTDGTEITSNAGDAFRTEEKSFDKEASFVFSATVNFNSGECAGLTFGETVHGRFAFTADRASNRVKLSYFTAEEDGFSETTLREEHFIGNGKMTEAERDIVEPKVRTVSKIYLKAVVIIEDGNPYLECYADGIQRFAFVDGSEEAQRTDINALEDGLFYEGGNIGYFARRADVRFTEAEYGASESTYYNELYRNQFHFSPFAHWNNDPNGLVYYNGYYHLFYQHYPFDKVWGDMYWGHARSTDLMHWENLPICLFPERGGKAGSFGNGDGFMWSGSARIYHKGESAVIDGEKWFGEAPSFKDGDGVGLIAFYTRDGAQQDQMIMSSDDGGLSWTKRRYIPSQQILNLGTEKKDCRDPKVFEFDDNGRTVYGMMLTGMQEPYNVWFLKSYNLVDWSEAGGFKAKVPLVNTDSTNGPECPDIAFFEVSGKEIAVITLAGRGYITGELSFSGGKFILRADGVDISTLDYTKVPVKQMDFGPDSYATQTFYIEDGEYKDKTVSVSWFSGVPGAEASVDSGLLTDLRNRWNCGMTVPVVWNLIEKDGDYVLTQTPITKDNNINKTVLASVTAYEAEAGADVLKNLKSSAFEIDAEIDNPEGGAVAFRVRVGENEYTEIGWNETDGYYLDRTHTACGNLLLPRYKGKFTAATDDREKLSFCILVDNGGVEVFCGNGAYAFYAVTFASPSSDGMSFVSEKDVTFGKLKISSISSVYRKNETSYLRLGCDNVELDLTLSKQKDIVVDGSQNVEYEITEGADVVSYRKTDGGIRLLAASAGEARIKATCGDRVEYISVSVCGGSADSDVEYNDVLAGGWYLSDEGYRGVIKSGDAFILSEREGSDFLYSARFDLNGGVAAALVFRSNADKSEYIMANYDHGAGLVKLWSSADPVFETKEENEAEYKRRNIPVRLNDLTDVTLTVRAEGSNIRVYLNQQLLIDYTYNDNAPLSGKFGLNVCSADVQFKTVAVTDITHEKYTEGDVSWNHTDESVFTVTNLGLNNKLVDSGFYKVEGRKVTLSQNYLSSLPRTGQYTLEVRGNKCLYHIVIDVGSIPSPVWQDIKLQEKSNAVFYIGGTVSDKVVVNGKALGKSQYKIDGTQLIIYYSSFRLAENEVSYGDNLKAKVTVEELAKIEAGFNESDTGAIYTALFVIVGVVLVAEAALIAFIILKKDKKGETEDVGNDQGRS